VALRTTLADEVNGSERVDVRIVVGS